MKNIVTAFVILAIGNLAFSQEVKEVDRDFLVLGNALIKPSVLKCIEQVQAQNKAEFFIRKIIKSKSPDITRYELNGELLVGGDVGAGYATIDVTVNYQPFMGFVYNCSLRK